MKRYLAGFIACVILLIPAACAKQDDDREPYPSSSLESEVPVTLPLPAIESPSQTLRAASRQETDLNPLYPKHYATQSLLRLVYQSLYDVSADGRLLPVLAEKATWSADGLTLTVSLRPDKLFHNGNAVQAGDVVASFKTYLRVNSPSSPLTEREEESDGLILQEVDRDDLYQRSDLFQPLAFSLTEAHRLQSLSNIAGLEVASQSRFVIQLHTPDPLLIRHLTFPVLPEAYADERTMHSAPGTGAWSLDSVGDQGFTLTSVEGGGSVTRIQVTAFARIQEAVRAFEEGEIDLLLMDASETTLYADRSRIKKQSLDDGGFVSLYFAGSPDKALAMRDALLYVLQKDPSLESIAAPLEQASHPILSGDFRLSGKRIPLVLAPVPDDSILGQGGEGDEAGKPQESSRKPFRLLVPEAYLPARLIDRIGTALLQLDRQLTVSQASADMWQEALKSGQYDAALLVDAGDGFPDPADYLDSLADRDLFDWSQAVDPEDRVLLLDARQLPLAGDKAEAGDLGDYPASLSRVFAQVPVVGLAASARMVWYSNDVEGILMGTWRSPYLGVEDLLIWGP